MLKAYSILSKCLVELKNSDLPIIEKLKLEVQLIQTKRILLDERVERRVAGLASVENKFTDLYDQIRYACMSGRINGEVDRIKSRVHEIKDLTLQYTQ